MGVAVNVLPTRPVSSATTATRPIVPPTSAVLLDAGCNNARWFGGVAECRYGDVALRTGLARIANLPQYGAPRPERYPSLALGTKEVTPLELAAAYATFVNGGRRVYPKVVTSVGEPPGTHLDASEHADAQVISPTTAYMITNMLSAVVDHGTARAARDVAKTTAVAGKTGTSRDGWFVGYTPNLVCVVWIGFDDNQQLGLTVRKRRTGMGRVHQGAVQHD